MEIFAFDLDPFLGDQMNLDITIIKTASAFCNKIWQATRFLILAHERTEAKDVRCAEVAAGSVHKPDLGVEERWILSRYSGELSLFYDIPVNG